MELYKVLNNLKSEEELKIFFEDICTPQEIANMNQRIACARMLQNGETYTSIIEKTGISSATLSRISKCMQHSNGGFSTLIKRYDEQKDK
ncbi:MAG: hypothetical protein IK048_01725 [Clostridia bacterium]|nr:hypothetical protein [Clostridia bacterium]